MNLLSIMVHTFLQYVNIASGSGLLPDGTKLSPEPTLTICRAQKMHLRRKEVHENPLFYSINLRTSNMPFQCRYRTPIVRHYIMFIA